MQIQKKDATIKKAQEHIEIETKYQWQSDWTVPGVEKKSKSKQEHTNWESRGVVNVSAIFIQKTVQTVRGIKKEVEKITQKNSNEETNSEQNIFSGTMYSFIVFVSFCFFFFCSSVLILLTFTENSFSQIGATDIVKIAEQEESIWEHNVGGKKYKQWYGINGNWCAMFVSYCANSCGYIEDGIMPKSASVASMAKWYQQRGQFAYKTNGFGEYYEPKAGDIIFFQNGMSHVGIVVDYDSENKKVIAIEGNTGSSVTEPYHAGSRVKRKTYPITYKKITGYGQPNYPITSEMTEEILNENTN